MRKPKKAYSYVCDSCSMVESNSTNSSNLPEDWVIENKKHYCYGCHRNNHNILKIKTKEYETQWDYSLGHSLYLYNGRITTKKKKGALLLKNAVVTKAPTVYDVYMQVNLYLNDIVHVVEDPLPPPVVDKDIKIKL